MREAHSAVGLGNLVVDPECARQCLADSRLRDLLPLEPVQRLNREEIGESHVRERVVRILCYRLLEQLSRAQQGAPRS